MKVLVTGSSGFVGKAVVARLARDAALTARAAHRGNVRDLPAGVESATVGALSAHADWSDALAGCDAVIHAAARVHVLDETSADPLGAFRAVNVDGTVRLATQAVAAGVRRFVFVSSIKVNGERSAQGRPFRISDLPAPVDPYGISKHEAEMALQQLAAASGLEVVIVRPVLVYGPGVKANFESMLRWVHRGIPLPLGAVNNRRSMVALDNLTDLLVRCVTHPAAPGRTFFASDDDDVSTTELLRRAAHALGRPSRLVPVPPPLLRAAAAAVGKGDIAVRLFDSLQVDISETRGALHWAPPVPMREALARTAADFLARAAG